MADWRETALTILLSDGAIDDREVNVIRKELFADGKIDRVAAHRKGFEFRIDAHGQSLAPD